MPSITSALRFFGCFSLPKNEKTTKENNNHSDAEITNLTSTQLQDLASKLYKPKKMPLYEKASPTEMLTNISSGQSDDSWASLAPIKINVISYDFEESIPNNNTIKAGYEPQAGYELQADDEFLAYEESGLTF